MLDKMKNKLWIIGTALLFFSSCGERQCDTVNYDCFPVEDSLTGQLVSDVDSIFTSGTIFVTGDWLVTFQRSNPRPFRFYRLSNPSESFESGYMGHGANEFGFISQDYFQSQPDGSFLLLDNYRLKRVALQADSTLKTLWSKTTFELVPINGFVQCGENRCISFADCATGTIGDLEYRMLNLKTGKERKFSPYPKLHKGELDQDERCQLYYKRLVVNEKQQKLMAFYSKFPYIRLYENYTDLKKEIVFGEKQKMSDPSKRYYGNTCSSDNCVFAISTAGLEVWSWDAEPIALYHLDKPISYIAFDSHTETLYVESYDRKNDCSWIYAYSIPSH